MRQSKLAFLLLLVPLFFLAVGTASAVSTGTYWKKPNQTLWVYDKTPELGIGSHDLGGGEVPTYRDLGIRLVRHTLYWSAADPGLPNGAYDENYLQAFISRVYSATHSGTTRNEIEPVIVVHSEPGRYSYGNHAEAYARFATFMRDMAYRMPDVRYWELWNEQDAGATGLFGAGAVNVTTQGSNYAAMLKQAYPAIKQQNPNAWVLVGGLIGVDNWNFIRGIYQGGGSDFFDFMAIHTYGAEAQVSNDGFRTRAELALGMMATAGGQQESSRPLWNTEFGASANDYVLAWDLPHFRNPAFDDGTEFDKHQQKWWSDALYIHRTSGLYTKALGYQLRAQAEDPLGCMKWGRGIDNCRIYIENYGLPYMLNANNYSHGLFRSDGVTKRPTYWDVKNQGFNNGLVDQRTENITVYAPGLQPIGYASTTSGGYVTIYNVPVRRTHPTVINFQAAAPTTPAGCGEASCVPAQGTYISHFTGANCTGTESYYLPYDNYGYQCRTWNGTGQCGTIRRTVTNYSYRYNGGACNNNAWPAGNTLSNFVTVYR